MILPHLSWESRKSSSDLSVSKEFPWAETCFDHVKNKARSDDAFCLRLTETRFHENACCQDYCQAGVNYRKSMHNFDDFDNLRKLLQDNNNTDFHFWNCRRLCVKFVLCPCVSTYCNQQDCGTWGSRSLRWTSKAPAFPQCHETNSFLQIICTTITNSKKDFY